MKKIKSSSQKLIITAITALTLIGCGEKSTVVEPDNEPIINIETPFTGDSKKLKMIYWQAPTILNPHLSTGFKDLEASRITLEPLATFNKEGELLPILAEEIPSPENGGVAEDGLSVTWKLRQGIKWSDGEEFTAEDVAWCNQTRRPPPWCPPAPDACPARSNESPAAWRR